MKNILTFIYAIVLLPLYSQHKLSEIDTALNFKSLYYFEGKLTTTNSLVYCNPESGGFYTKEFFASINQSGLDTSKMDLVKHGNWIEYFDKEEQMVTDENYKSYCLSTYNKGYQQGKTYYFQKGGRIIKTIENYPIYKDTVFEGFREIGYKRNKINYVTYERFDEDSSKGSYINISTYFSNGNLKEYVLNDDFNHKYEVMIFNPRGICTKELIVDHLYVLDVKRKRNGRKEIIETVENDKLYEIIKIDGIEIKRKEI